MVRVKVMRVRARVRVGVRQDKTTYKTTRLETRDKPSECVGQGTPVVQVHGTTSEN